MCGAVSDVLAVAMDALLEHVPVGGLVADLGCGPGRDGRARRAARRRAVGVDLSLGMLRRAAARACGRLVAGDLRALPLASGSLDGVWSSYALLHLDDEGLATALLEVARVLRPGGAAALVLAAGQGGREPVGYAPEHERVFFVREPAVVRGVAEAAGLEVVSLDVVREAWRSPVRLLARRP